MAGISVIVPIYNVSNFIEKCATSLLNQSLKDVEYLFVDDASPDDSIAKLEAIIAKFPERNVTLLHHKNNLGLPSARNTGLMAATGDFVFHCDGDDWLEINALEQLLNSAVASNADLVYCDFYLSYEDHERRMGNPDFSDGDKLLRDGFLGGTMKYNVWNKLVRRSIYTDNNIRFPDGHSMGEDMTMIMLAAKCKTVVHLPNALYHYVKMNSNAYSQNQSEKNLADTRFNVDRTISFLKETSHKDLDTDIAFFKLSIKLPFLITDDESQYEIWKEWYPEANKFATANMALPFRTRFLQWLAAHSMFKCVKIYYILVYKVFYKIIYR